MSAIPADILKAAEDALDNALCHDVEAYGGSYEDSRNAAIKAIAGAILAERERCDIACQALIDEYVKAERERCANSVWDFYYGEKRGHVTPEEFAEFLQPKP